MADQISQVINFAVPAILLIVAVGFAWVKFGEPYVLPLLIKMFAWIQNKNEERKESGGSTEKYIAFD